MSHAPRVAYSRYRRGSILEFQIKNNEGVYELPPYTYTYNPYTQTRINKKVKPPEPLRKVTQDHTEVKISIISLSDKDHQKARVSSSASAVGEAGTVAPEMSFDVTNNMDNRKLTCILTAYIVKEIRDYPHPAVLDGASLPEPESFITEYGTHYLASEEYGASVSCIFECAFSDLHKIDAFESSVDIKGVTAELCKTKLTATKDQHLITTMKALHIETRGFKGNTIGISADSVEKLCEAIDKMKAALEAFSGTGDLLHAYHKSFNEMFYPIQKARALEPRTVASDVSYRTVHDLVLILMEKIALYQRFYGHEQTKELCSLCKKLQVHYVKLMSFAMQSSGLIPILVADINDLLARVYKAMAEIDAKKIITGCDPLNLSCKSEKVVAYSHPLAKAWAHDKLLVVSGKNSEGGWPIMLGRHLGSECFNVHVGSSARIHCAYSLAVALVTNVKFSMLMAKVERSTDLVIKYGDKIILLCDAGMKSVQRYESYEVIVLPARGSIYKLGDPLCAGHEFCLQDSESKKYLETEKSEPAIFRANLHPDYAKEYRPDLSQIRSYLRGYFASTVDIGIKEPVFSGLPAVTFYGASDGAGAVALRVAPY